MNERGDADSVGPFTLKIKHDADITNSIIYKYHQ